MATREEALYNVLQFAGDKKSGSGGQIRLETRGDIVTAMAHDDFTFIIDSFPNDLGVPDGIVYVDKEDVKAFLKDSGVLMVDVQSVDADSFEMGLELIRDAKKNNFHVAGFALSAERFRKLSLVKPQGNPVDLMACDDGGHPYVAFKIGPTAKGLLSVLDRSVVSEELGPEVLW